MRKSTIESRDTIMGTGTHEEEQMADSYDRSESAGGAGFMMGLLAGTVLGAGLGMLLAPSAGSELRGQLGERARNLGNIAADQYKKAGEAANDWAGRGREMVDRAREAVSRGAQEARGYATGTTGSAFGGSTGTAGSSNGPAGGGNEFGRP